MSDNFPLRFAEKGNEPNPQPADSDLAADLLRDWREKGLIPKVVTDRTIEPRDKVLAAVTQLRTETGVNIVSEKGRLIYSINVNGTYKELGVTSDTTYGVKMGRQLIESLIERKKKELADDPALKLAFSSEGEIIGAQRVKSENGRFEKGKPITARGPRLVELYAIETAVRKCIPSHLTANSDTGVKFYFLNDEFVKGEKPLAYFIHADKDKRAAIYFLPDATTNRTPTEADRKESDRLKPWTGTKHRQETIESLVLHELSHNHQWRLKWRGVASSNELSAAMRMGWIAYLDKDSAQFSYLFISSEKEPGGTPKYYKYDSDASIWFRSNREGEWLDKDGKKSSRQKAETLTREEMREKAWVRPVTWYFENPLEMFAEAMMLFRMGGDDRAYLLKESPDLYRLIQEEDQREIDQEFGKDGDKSILVRSSDGILRKNTELAQAALRAFEARVRGQ